EAKYRSDDDQRELKNKAIREQERRQDSWAERDIEAIEIKGTSSYTTSSYDIGVEADLEIDDSGEDNSGLNKLRSKVEEESTDIDFDAELREVSQIQVD
ncbi:MAG: hypothetical protein MJK18_01495, partial [Bdellovibrionales bacterium]|nr:hypothetical protein [Bdellovibrionales bacterium]